MLTTDYKNAYSEAKGTVLDKVRHVVLHHYHDWEMEEFEDMIQDVLNTASSTAEDIMDILELILEQQGGNLSFKRAVFTLKAEIRKSYRNLMGHADMQKPPMDEGLEESFSE